MIGFQYHFQLISGRVSHGQSLGNFGNEPNHLDSDNFIHMLIEYYVIAFGNLGSSDKSKWQCVLLPANFSDHQSTATYGAYWGACDYRPPMRPQSGDKHMLQPLHPDTHKHQEANWAECCVQ